MEIKCPICNQEIKENYCPECGLPIDGRHMRPELQTFNRYQNCCHCNSRNPHGARYCQNCGKWMHEYVDLGLSVLWSKKRMQYIYSWLDSSVKHSDKWPPDENFKEDGKDVATEEWGNGWRIPTKKEFEELIEKCRWEKVIIPCSSTPALKVIGPNENFVYFPVRDSFFSHFAFYESWTLTEDAELKTHAYRFCYGQDFKTSNLPIEEFNALWLSTPLAELKLQRINKAHALSIHPVIDKHR